MICLLYSSVVHVIYFSLLFSTAYVYSNYHSDFIDLRSLVHVYRRLLIKDDIENSLTKIYIVLEGQIVSKTASKLTCVWLGAIA